MTKVKIKLDQGVEIPVYAHRGDSGVDIKAKETLTIEAMETKLVPTGIYLQMEEGVECQIRPRSGISLKTSLRIANSPATIDQSYTGHCQIIVQNQSNEPIIIDKGLKIAQMVFVPVLRAEFELVDSFDETDRGEGCFGSTGFI